VKERDRETERERGSEKEKGKGEKVFSLWYSSVKRHWLYYTGFTFPRGSLIA